MKVKAATVEQHSFTVRRRGYDRAEVDAVMGQLGRSLRNYEEERVDAEARPTQVELASHAISASFATVQQAGQELAAQTRMESEAMMREAEEAVAGARQQAEAILAVAKDAIEKMLESIAGEAEKVLSQAESDAADHRTKIEAEAAELLAASKAEAARLNDEADATKSEAEALKEAAAAEAAEMRAEATLQAAATVEMARLEHDKLATRIPELRTALSRFEAQVAALQVPAIDLTKIEAVEAETSAPTSHAVSVPVADDAGAVPIPDGSGTLPAARQLVDLDEYRELKEIPKDDPAPEEAAGAVDVATEEAVIKEILVDEVAVVDVEVAEVEEAAVDEVEEAAVDEVAAESVKKTATGAGAPLERLAATHVASRGIPTDNETIYQRRGGGLRRRIKAQGDE